MDYEGFKKEILSMTSINLSYYKEKQMKRRIDSLIRKHNFENYYDYIREIKTNKVLFDEFVNYITINVSEFFRNPEQWQVLEREILPTLMSKNKNLKIWSAACSTGDEPYSLVMLLSKFMPLSNIKILATDIDRKAIEKAKAGKYVEKSLDKLPDEYVKKFFTTEGNLYRVKDEIKNCVQFMHHNLLKDDYPKECDLIVCRNVLIYFTDEAKNNIYTKFNGALKKGGVLFVGSTEQIMAPARYKLESFKTFFYTKEEDL